MAPMLKNVNLLLHSAESFRRNNIYIIFVFMKINTTYAIRTYLININFITCSEAKI